MKNISIYWKKRNCTKYVKKRNCLDNAIIENSLDIKIWTVYLKKIHIIDQLKKEINDYVKYYNNDRIKSNLTKWARYNIELIIMKKLIINLSKLWGSPKAWDFFCD
jgi:hypothetical protein